MEHAETNGKGIPLSNKVEVLDEKGNPVYSLTFHC